jgi:hypothetical protein
MVLRPALFAYVLLLHGALALVPQRLAAQDGAGSVVVTVRSELTAQRLRGVEVTVHGLPFRWITDRNGIARIKGLPIGDQTLTARVAGYTTTQTLLSLGAGEMSLVMVELTPDAVQLDSIEVAGSPRSRQLDRHGFYRRKITGPGVFLDRQALLKGSPRSFPEALRRVAGVSISPGRFSDARVSMGRSGGSQRCAIQYFLDGMPVHAYDPNHMMLEAVEGVEVYRGASEVPPQYNRGTALCGVIVIWTRQGERRRAG